MSIIPAKAVSSNNSTNKKKQDGLWKYRKLVSDVMIAVSLDCTSIAQDLRVYTPVGLMISALLWRHEFTIQINRWNTLIDTYILTNKQANCSKTRLQD